MTGALTDEAEFKHTIGIPLIPQKGNLLYCLLGPELINMYCIALVNVYKISNGCVGLLSYITGIETIFQKVLTC